MGFPYSASSLRRGGSLRSAGLGLGLGCCGCHSGTNAVALRLNPCVLRRLIAVRVGEQQGRGEMGEPEPEPEVEPEPQSQRTTSSARMMPTTPSDLPSPFSQNSRVRSNFEGLAEASKTLSKQISGVERAVEHATSRGQKGGRTAMQHLVGDSSIVGELGTLLEHGGIYCEAMVTVDEHGNTIPCAFSDGFYVVAANNCR